MSTRPSGYTRVLITSGARAFLKSDYIPLLCTTSTQVNEQRTLLGKQIRDSGVINNIFIAADSPGHSLTLLIDFALHRLFFLSQRVVIISTNDALLIDCQLE